MRIGIDISQVVYEGTGVGNYVRRIVTALLKLDKKNDYVLFGASLRRRDVFRTYFPKEKLVTVPIPPTILEFLWNRLHIVPVEWFTGTLDIFWSSDWTQPPLIHAKGVTTIHDLTPLLFPKETDDRIVAVHKRRLVWVKRECNAIFCDSIATKNDAVKLLKIPKNRLHIVYPGI